MKEYLTMKEAGLLLGKTSKTIKNYIKRGVIRNYFLVDGKYGQEYKISLKDLEPLGIIRLDVLKDDFTTRDLDHFSGNIQENVTGISRETIVNTDTASFIQRYEKMVLELDKMRVDLGTLTEENKRLKQELQEKEMLIQVLMRRGSATEKT